MNRIEEYRKKWLEIGISTSESNYSQICATLQRVYEIRGLHNPSRIILVDSPPACLCAYTLFNEKSFPVKGKVRGYLHPFFSNKLRTRYRGMNIYPPIVDHIHRNRGKHGLTKNLSPRIAGIIDKIKHTMQWQIATDIYT